MNKLNWVLWVITTVAIAGCIETKDEFTVNPDGSGKVIHEITFQPMDLGMMGEMGSEMMGEMAGAMGEMTGEMGNMTADMTAEMTADMGEMMGKMMGGEPSDPQAQLKKSVKEILSQSSGVDTWKDISYKLTDDGRMYFKGTAFFPNINNLSLHNAGFDSDMKLHFTRDISGEITIELKSQEQDEGTETVEPAIPEIPEAQLNIIVKQARLQYTQMKPMMQGILSTMKSETILHLPAGIKEISNFEKVDNRTVRIILDGSKMLEVMDRMMQDEDWLKEQIRAGKDPLQDGPEGDLDMNEMLFGEKAPVRVVLAGGAQQLFDYDAEVTAAKANYENMLKKLGIEEAVPARPTIGDVSPFPGFREVTPTAPERVTGEMNVKVAGVRLVRYSDFERGIMPLGQSDGYTLSLIGELPAPAIRASGGKIEVATTDTGKSLLPEHQWGRKIKFPKLAKDKKTVVFDVELLLPDEDVEGLEEVSGVLEYLTATGTKQIDLGIMDLKDGAKSNVEDFSIKSIKKKPGAWEKGNTYMHIGINLLRGSIKDVKLYREDGTEIKTFFAGSSYMKDRLINYNIRTKGEFPPRGRIVFEVLDGITKHEIPFKLTNISLTGQSLW